MGKVDRRSLRRTAVLLWAAVSSITVVVWALISLLSWHADPPWFLWTTAGGGLLAGLVWLATADRTSEAGSR